MNVVGYPVTTTGYEQNEIKIEPKLDVLSTSNRYLVDEKGSDLFWISYGYPMDSCNSWEIPKFE